MITIEACLIVKNEENFIESLVDNLSKFCDRLNIVETSPTDSTLDKLNEMKKTNKKLNIIHFDWVYDFGAARNFAFSQASKSCDYIFWCDGSDDFTPQLIDELCAFKKNCDLKHSADVYEINRKYDVLDIPLLGLVRRSKGLKWKDPIHEYIEFVPGTRVSNNQFSKDAYLIHRNFSVRDDYHKNRNIDIFFNMDEINREFSYRNLLYYGNEMFDHGRKLTAYIIYSITMYNGDKFLSPGEQLFCFIRMYICRNERKMPLFDKPLIEHGKWLYNNNIKSDIFLSCMGDLYFEAKDYEKAIRMYKEAMSHKNQKYYTCDLMKTELNVSFIRSQIMLSYDHLGDYKSANEWNELIIKDEPTNKLALDNRKYFATKLF